MVVIVFALVALGAAGCGNGDDTGSSSASTSATSSDTEGTAVAATVQDSRSRWIRPRRRRVRSTSSITNDGPSTHEFVVVKTDTAPDALPTADGEVTEDGIDVAGEAEDIAPSTEATLSLDLEAGSYVIICNVVGHYEQGMNTGFTVA